MANTLVVTSPAGPVELTVSSRTAGIILTFLGIGLLVAGLDMLPTQSPS